MNSIVQLRVFGSLFLVSSMVFTGCTASETKQEPILSKSSSSPELLTAGLKAIGENESQKNNTTLIFFVNNETEADKKLLIWNSPVEQPLSADIFSVQLNGVKLDCQGRMIKRGSPMPEHFRIVKAGDTLETVVDISSYYDMSVAGSYTVSLDPVEADGTYLLNEQTLISFVPETLVLTVP